MGVRSRVPGLSRGAVARAAAALVTAALLLGVGPCSPGTAAAQPSGPIPPGIGFAPRLGGKVPRDIALVDEGGRPVRFGDFLSGKRPVVVVLAYYECPMLCTMVLNGLVTALQKTELAPAADFQVVVASIDPADTPAKAAAKKAAYVAHYDRPGAEEGLHFLTGTGSEVRRLADAVGFSYKYDPVGKQFAHAAGITLLAGDGTITHAFHGVDFPPRDLRLGLVEAAQGAIGTARDRLLLLCFRYDPEKGRYGALAFTSIRAGGALTLALMAVLMLAMRRRPGGGAPRGRIQ